MVGSGLPVATGSMPVACRSAATIDPLPGNGPRWDGTVGSRFVATHGTPRRIATASFGELFPVQFG